MLFISIPEMRTLESGNESKRIYKLIKEARTVVWDPESAWDFMKSRPSSKPWKAF
jgi:hypothetical protein